MHHARRDRAVARSRIAHADHDGLRPTNVSRRERLRTGLLAHRSRRCTEVTLCGDPRRVLERDVVRGRVQTDKVELRVEAFDQPGGKLQRTGRWRRKPVRHWHNDVTNGEWREQPPDTSGRVLRDELQHRTDGALRRRWQARPVLIDVERSIVDDGERDSGSTRIVEPPPGKRHHAGVADEQRAKVTLGWIHRELLGWLHQRVRGCGPVPVGRCRDRRHDAEHDGNAAQQGERLTPSEAAAPHILLEGCGRTCRAESDAHSGGRQEQPEFGESKWQRLMGR